MASVIANVALYSADSVLLDKTYGCWIQSIILGHNGLVHLGLHFYLTALVKIIWKMNKSSFKDLSSPQEL